MKILVTGSAGFVGSDLVPTLNAQGHETIGIDTVPESHSKKFHQYDLTKGVPSAIPAFDLCIHLASSVGGILFNASCLDMVEVNEKINATVVGLCKAVGCENMIFFSTINVFETSPTFHHAPIDVIDQKSPYAISKINGEQFLRREMTNLIVLRPTNIFGRNQLRRHDRVGESHVIPDLLMKIDNSDCLEVLGDGSQIRNFVHVSDLVRFVTKSLNFHGHHFLNLRSSITVILAAGEGTRLRPYTDDRPKCMVEVDGISLLDRQIEVLHSESIEDIVLVTGYKAERITRPDVIKVLNRRYAETNMVSSLFCAESYMSGGALVAYGDIVYSRNILRKLLSASADIAVAIDLDWEVYWHARNENVLDDAETLKLSGDGRILELGRKPISISEIEGQYMGLVKYSERGMSALKSAFHKARDSGR